MHCGRIRLLVIVMKDFTAAVGKHFKATQSDYLQAFYSALLTR
jgi:hypothetical protein